MKPKDRHEAQPAISLQKRRAHYNGTGQADAFSEFINARLENLGYREADFAQRTAEVPIRSAAVAASTSKAPRKSGAGHRSDRSLINRVLSGKRPLPVERILSWAEALNLTTQKKRQAFLVLALLANGLRTIRRTVADQDLRTQLEADLRPEIDRMIKEWFGRPPHGR